MQRRRKKKKSSNKPKGKLKGIQKEINMKKINEIKTEIYFIKF